MILASGFPAQSRPTARGPWRPSARRAATSWAATSTRPKTRCRRTTSPTSIRTQPGPSASAGAAPGLPVSPPAPPASTTTTSTWSTTPALSPSPAATKPVPWAAAVILQGPPVETGTGVLIRRVEDANAQITLVPSAMPFADWFETKSQEVIRNIISCFNKSQCCCRPI